MKSNGSDATESHELTDSAFRVADLMLWVLAIGLAAGMTKRHMDESAMAFRLNAHPPLSVWTRLVIGHSLSSFAVVFGLSRLILALRDRRNRVTFGSWLWSVIGLYVPLHVLASVLWALTNTVLRPVLSGSRPASVPITETVSRVALMTFGQACFDELAWMLAAIWIVTASLKGVVQFAGEIEAGDSGIARQDVAVSIFTGLAIFATVFQRILESLGY